MNNLLKVIDDSKTLQILLEKFLIALLIMLATYCINRNLEAFKTRNTIAEVSISKFINSTNDIWKKIDEFEDLTSELCSDAFIYILKEKKNDKYSFQYKSEYAVKFKQYTTLKKEVFDLINKQRTSNGLSTLQIDSEVQRAARIKAQDMVNNNYFSHTSPTYGSPFEMLKSFKVPYNTAGENIAGNSSNTAAVNAWMNSSGHRANILNSSFNYTGIGVVNGSQYGKIYVQMFIGK